jgi:sugar/nucleoside kinase (ribokinase family)
MPRPWLSHVAEAVAAADVLLCDEAEACGLFDVPDAEAALAPAHAAGPRIVAIKRGEQGVLVSDGGRVIQQPAAPVDPALVAESIGAGDAFDAGFLDALARGDDLAGAARYGCATALLSLTGRGGAEGIGGRDAVQAALRLVPDGRPR